jgi:hypothetical protein
VKVGESAKLFAANAAWRLGSRRAGKRLVDGLASSDENNRLIAGMLLVRAGKGAVPLLAEELRHPRNLPLLLRIMGDVAPEEFRDVLERHASHPDPMVARAAKDALRSR